MRKEGPWFRKPDLVDVRPLTRMRLMTERGRFAPSPTGELHLGNARTAILAWLWARSEGGGFTMRVEDLDRPRVRPGLARRQLEELDWLGITWDEGPDPRTGHDLGARGPYRQSERTAKYEAALVDLGDHVYECFCSRAEIAAAAMGVTQVLRGEDLLPSTARQILLYRLLGLREPRWAHAGLVASASGERLSKRDRAASLSALRAAGRDPGELVTRLCAVSGLPELPGRGLADRVSTFALPRVARGTVRLDRP